MRAKCLLIGIVGLFVAGVLTTSSYAKMDPKTVVGMWLFDDDGGDVAADSSENENDGTLIGGPEWTDGKFDEALQFDGTDDYVEIANADSLNVTGDFTFSMWLKISAYPTGWRGMLSKGTGDFQNEFNFRYKNPTGGHFYFGSGGGAIICEWVPSEDLPVDAWTHVVGVRKSKTYHKLYFDGIEKRSEEMTDDAVSTDANVTIGRESWKGFYFQGLIDEVAILNAALEPEDIQTLMDEGLKESFIAVEFSGKLVSTWAALRK